MTKVCALCEGELVPHSPTMGEGPKYLRCSKCREEYELPSAERDEDEETDAEIKVFYCGSHHADIAVINNKVVKNRHGVTNGKGIRDAMETILKRRGSFFVFTEESMRAFIRSVLTEKPRE